MIKCQVSGRFILLIVIYFITLTNRFMPNKDWVCRLLLFNSTLLPLIDRIDFDFIE